MFEITRHHGAKAHVGRHAHTAGSGIARALKSAVLAGCSLLAMSATAGATTIDTTPGTSTIGSFGEPNTATYGQTFTAPVNDDAVFDSFTFYMNDQGGAPVRFSAYVMEWDPVNNRAIGPVLFASPVTATPGVAGVNAYTFAPGTMLTPGKQYVAFFSASNAFDTVDDAARWDSRNDADAYAGGGFVYNNNGAVFADLTATPLTTDFQGPGYDLAFVMNFVAPVVEEAAMLSASQTMLGGCFRSEHGVAGASNDPAGRAWAKVNYGKRNTGPDTGLNAEQEYTCGSGGIALRAGENWRIGMSGGHGQTSSDVHTVSGTGLLEGDGGMLQIAAAVNHGAFFANLAVGYGQSNWTYTRPTTAAQLDASLNGLVGSLEVGGLWPIGNDWRFGAIAEIDYDGLDCDAGDCLMPSSVVDPNEWFWKATLRVDGTVLDGKLHPFVTLSYVDGDTNTITNGVATLTTDTNSSLLEAKAGASVMIGERTSLFASGGIVEGLENDVDGYNLAGGIRITW